MKNLRPKSAYFAAKENQFKSVVQDAKERGINVVTALTEAGYNIAHLGSTTICQKGRAVVTFEGKNVGEITTLPHYI